MLQIFIDKGEKKQQKKLELMNSMLDYCPELEMGQMHQDVSKHFKVFYLSFDFGMTWA